MPLPVPVPAAAAAAAAAGGARMRVWRLPRVYVCACARVRVWTCAWRIVALEWGMTRAWQYDSAEDRRRRRLAGAESVVAGVIGCDSEGEEGGGEREGEGQ